MSTKNQWLAYFAQQLGYFSSEKISEVIAKEISLENYMKECLTNTQFSCLKFLYVKNCLLKNAQKFGYITEEQSQQLLANKITALQNGQQEPEWEAVRQLVPQAFIHQCAQQLYSQKIFTQEDLKMLIGATKNFAPSLHPESRQDSLEILKKKIAPQTLKRLGPYHIREELGRGGMGKVYKAYHPGLDRSGISIFEREIWQKLTAANRQIRRSKESLKRFKTIYI